MRDLRIGILGFGAWIEPFFRCHWAQDIEDCFAEGQIGLLMKFEGSRALDGWRQGHRRAE